MASILNVDQINNAAGTSAVTLDPSTGHATFPNGMTLPAGSVVQVQQYYLPSSAGLFTSSASFVPTGFKKTISPLYSTSLIIVQASISMAHTSGYGLALIYVNGSAMPGVSNYHLGYTNVSYNNYAPLICQAQFQATSTASLEFEMYVKAGSGTYTYSHGSSSAGLTLWEIAQ